MKDVTITSFGLIIAYLLPGFAGLYGLSFWSVHVSLIFSTFSTSASNIGLFLVVILASLIIGSWPTAYVGFVSSTYSLENCASTGR